jgi:hypothetical protein
MSSSLFLAKGPQGAAIPFAHSSKDRSKGHHIIFDRHVLPLKSMSVMFQPDLS